MPKMKTIFGYVIIVGVVWWIVTKPIEAGTAINHLISLLTVMIAGFGQFLGAL